MLTQDWPSITNIEGTELAPAPPAAGGAGGRGGNANAGPSPAATYRDRCAICHAADWTGSPTVPALVGIGARMRLDDFRSTVATGRGEMPAFAGQLDAAAIDALFNYFTGGGRGGGGFGGAAGADLPVGGLVVASGGAPGGLIPPPVSEAVVQAQYGGNNRFVGPPYPKGVEAPAQRLYSGYGLNWPTSSGRRGRRSSRTT